MAKATDGLVDPTLGAAIEEAGYVCDFARLRDDPRPVEAGPAGVWSSVRVVGTTVLRSPGVRLDLNGAVKSIAVDDALALLSGFGFVSAGGDLAVRGPVVVGLPEGRDRPCRAGWARDQRFDRAKVAPWRYRSASPDRPHDGPSVRVVLDGGDRLRTDLPGCRRRREGRFSSRPARSFVA